MIQKQRPVVELLEISKSFEGAAVPLYEDISLSFSAGESVAIVGPSGCGKSTLLNIIANLERPDKGTVLHNGTRTSAGDHVPQLGYLFQRDALLPWASVIENVLLGLECQKQADSAALDGAKEYLEKLGIWHLRDRKPSQLSGGQRQLIALVQSLLVSPNMLMLDEPFAHLDYQTKLFVQGEVMRLLRAERSNQARPMTLILVTHDIEEAIMMADRVMVIGGYPKTSSDISHEIVVDLADHERDPVKVRRSPEVARYFDDIWKELKSLSPLQGGS